MELAPTTPFHLLWVLLVGLALFFAPGWLLQAVIPWNTGKMGLPLAARIPLAFALSVGGTALLGLVCYVLGANLAVMQVAWALWAIFAAGVWLVQRWRRKSQPPAGATVASGLFLQLGWPECLVMAFALLCGALALWGGAWLSDRADAFYHLAAIHRLIDTGGCCRKGLLYHYAQPPTGLNPSTGTWHLSLALFSLWSGVDITWLWQHLPVMLAPLLVLAFYSFALTLTKKPWLAFCATLVQFILYDKMDFRVSMYSNQAGFVLLWMAWLLGLRYLEAGGRAELLLTLLSALVLTSWHPLLMEFFVLALAGYLTARVICLRLGHVSVRADVEVRRALTILLPLAALAIPLVVLRSVGTTLFNLTPARLAVLAYPPSFRSTLNLGYGFSIIGPQQLYIVDLRWRFAPLRFMFVVLAYLVSPFLIPGCLRRERLALFLFPTLALAPLVLFNPLLITYLQAKVNDIALLRLVLLPPYGLAVAWFFWTQLGGWLRLATSGRDGSSRLSLGRVLGLVGGGVLLALAAYLPLRQGLDNLFDLYSPASSHVYSMATVRQKERSTAQEPFRFLMAHARRTPSAIVASDSENSYYIGGLTGRSVISVPGGHHPPNVRDQLQRERDTLAILDPAADVQETVRLLDKYGVCFVWVDQRVIDLDPAAAARKFDAQPALFEQTYQDQEVRIYTYRAHPPGCVL